MAGQYGGYSSPIQSAYNGGGVGSTGLFDKILKNRPMLGQGRGGMMRAMGGLLGNKDAGFWNQAPQGPQNYTPLVNPRMPIQPVGPGMGYTRPIDPGMWNTPVLYGPDHPGVNPGMPQIPITGDPRPQQPMRPMVNPRMPFRRVGGR